MTHNAVHWTRKCLLNQGGVGGGGDWQLQTSPITVTWQDPEVHCLSAMMHLLQWIDCMAQMQHRTTSDHKIFKAHLEQTWLVLLTEDKYIYLNKIAGGFNSYFELSCQCLHAKLIWWTGLTLPARHQYVSIVIISMPTLALSSRSLWTASKNASMAVDIRSC